MMFHNDDAPSGHTLPSLRRYMSELYSAAWDIMSQNSNPLNIVVYKKYASFFSIVQGSISVQFVKDESHIKIDHF